MLACLARLGHQDSSDRVRHQVQMAQFGGSQFVSGGSRHDIVVCPVHVVGICRAETLTRLHGAVLSKVFDKRLST